MSLQEKRQPVSDDYSPCHRDCFPHVIRPFAAMAPCTSGILNFDREAVVGDARWDVSFWISRCVVFGFVFYVFGCLEYVECVVQIVVDFFLIFELL